MPLENEGEKQDVLVGLSHFLMLCFFFVLGCTVSASWLLLKHRSRVTFLMPFMQEIKVHSVSVEFNIGRFNDKKEKTLDI